jgi:hypothetical protein
MGNHLDGAGLQLGLCDAELEVVNFILTAKLRDNMVI